MDPKVLIDQWIIPIILILFAIILLFFPFFKKTGDKFGKANVHITVTHIIASLIFLGLAGGVVTGVISYANFKKAFSNLEMERDILAASNEQLSAKNNQLAKLIGESNNNVSQIQHGINVTQQKMRDASRRLANLKEKESRNKPLFLFSKNLGELISDLQKAEGTLQRADIKLNKQADIYNEIYAKLIEESWAATISTKSQKDFIEPRIGLLVVVASLGVAALIAISLMIIERKRKR